MEILLGYAIFWFIDRSIRQIGREIRDEYRKVTGRFAGKRAEKHPAAGKPPVTWRVGVKTAAVLGAGTVGAGRGGKNFATGFRDRWKESRQLAKANRDLHRQAQATPPNESKPGAPRRLADRVPPVEPTGEVCGQPGCRTQPVLPGGRCFEHSDDAARVPWLKDHEPTPPPNPVDLVKKPPQDSEPPEDTRSVGGLADPYPEYPDPAAQPEHGATPTTGTPTGGTVTDAVNYGQMIANTEGHISEANAAVESAKQAERQAHLAMDGAQASLKLAEENATKIEAEAANLASLRAPAELTSRVAALLEAVSGQKQAAEGWLQAAEAQQAAAAKRLAAADNTQASATALLAELQRLRNVVEAVDSLGGPQAIPDREFLTHG